MSRQIKQTRSPDSGKSWRQTAGEYLHRSANGLSFLGHPYFLMGGTFSLGLALIGLNAVLGHKPSWEPLAWTVPWLLNLGEKLGFVLAVSGVIGVVSRILWVTGALARALSDVMLGDAVLDIRNDLPQLLRRLTQRIYLHGFIPKTAADEDFLEKVHSAIALSVSQRHDFYARHMDAHFLIEEVEGQPGRLKITKTISYELRPLHPNRTIKHGTTITAANKIDIGEYDPREISFTVDGVPAVRKETRENDKVYNWIELSGGDKYAIQRVATNYALLDKDPVTVFAAPYLVDRLDFRAACEADNLATFFQEVGVEDVFVDMLASSPKARKRGDQHWRNNGILLPEQGFAFVVQRCR